MPEVLPSGSVARSEVETRVASPGSGEVRTIETSGARADILALYETLLQQSIGDVPANLTFRSANGRATVTANYERKWIGLGPSENDVQELYGFDVARDIRTAAYFAAMTNAQMAAVVAFWQAQQVDETGVAVAKPAGWTELQNRLYGHLTHGQESYWETAYELRITRQVRGSKQVNIAAANANTVQPLPALTSVLTRLIDALPAGEWLKKPTTVTPGSRGAWIVQTSYLWAPKWSIIYGGTFTGEDPA